MAEPNLVGPAYSTYTRSPRLALEEKGVGYTLEEIDFIGSGWPDGYAARHPFMKVPVLEHDGLVIYEGDAILRYVDEAFDGPALQPSIAAARARMSQAISIVDSYLYGPAVSSIFIQRAVVPMMGGETDEAVVAAAVPAVRTAASVLDGFLENDDYLASASVTLADLHLVPVLDYLRQTPEGEAVLADNARLAAWWERMSARESVVKTTPSLG